MADDFRDLFRNWQPGEDTPGSSGRREDAFDPNANPYETSAETENRTPRALNEKEVKVIGLWGATDPSNPSGPPRQTYVLLRDNRGRKAPIFIGAFETVAIQMALEGVTPERPLTHDLLRILVERLGAKVDRVTIDDLWQSTFYAKITLTTQAGETLDIDCRPSDAIALAVRVRAPIYMAEDVIEAAGREEE